MMADILIIDDDRDDASARARARLLSGNRQWKRFDILQPGEVIAHHGVMDPGVKLVQKPFSMKDLANRIREALES